MIRVIYHDVEPSFSATDNHPKAKRHKITVDGKLYFVDYLDDKPTAAEVRAVITPKKEK